MELTIEKLTYGGDGLARPADGPVCFIPYTAPGDRIEAEILESGRSFNRGRLTRILEASPQRTEPLCPYFGRCGGCQWQHLRYKDQLTTKGTVLQEQAARLQNQTPRFDPPLSADQPFEYRRRITLHAADGRIGYRAHRSREIIEIADCPIAEAPLREWLADPPLSREARKSLPERFELRIETDGMRLIRGDKEAGFLQANRGANEILRARVRELVLQECSAPRIFDLFCGNGNLSLPLAQAGASVEGWDSSSSAIAEAEVAAASLPAARYRRGEVGRIRKALFSSATTRNVLILDPPREGLKREAADLAGLGIGTILYVSCNPSTQMRDIAAFCSAGYSLVQLQGLDMFPQTYHIESIALLKRY